MKFNSTLLEWVKEDSLRPGKTVIVNTFPHIKAVTQVDDLLDMMLIQVREKDFPIKLLEIIVEDLVTLPHTEVSVSDQDDLMGLTLCQTVEGMLHQTHDSRFPPSCKGNQSHLQRALQE